MGYVFSKSPAFFIFIINVYQSVAGTSGLHKSLLVKLSNLHSK